MVISPLPSVGIGLRCLGMGSIFHRILRNIEMLIYNFLNQHCSGRGRINDILDPTGSDWITCNTRNPNVEDVKYSRWFSDITNKLQSPFICHANLKHS